MRPEAAKDSELALRLLGGDAGAFEEFVESFRARLFHYTLLMCGQREDAEEVAQETLMKVFENLEQLREPDRIRPWVFRIAKNVCLMKRRKSVFAPSEEVSLDEFLPTWRETSEGRKLEIADWSALPDRLAMRGQMSEMMQEAIQQLPELYKSVLLLRDMEELSTAEAAEALEISGDLVKTRLHRARLMLRQKLDAALRAGEIAHDA